MTTCLFPPAGLDKSAEISPCGQYRYTLTRDWAEGSSVTFLMFNPSTADASVDDQTIRKCVAFARVWGYGRMTVINLFALRNRDPRAVERAVDPVGPLNNFWIMRTIDQSRELVCAWGCGVHMRTPKVRNRVSEVLDMADARVVLDLSCLGYSHNGTPRHPLVLPYSTPRVPFVRREA